MRPTDPLYHTDAYARTCEARVLEVDEDAAAVALDRTVLYPGGGGQPCDEGSLTWADGSAAVAKVRTDGGVLWHTLADREALPAPGTEVEAAVDWERRYALMRTHTALHVLCGVIWAEFGVAVTGGNMAPGSGRLDFPLEAISGELGERLERRINEEIARAREVVVAFVERSDADHDPALIRTAAHLIPAHVDPLRVIDIVGLDKQADGGTHVASTAEVGGVQVTRTESKGRSHKRVRLALREATEAV